MPRIAGAMSPLAGQKAKIRVPFPKNVCRQMSHIQLQTANVWAYRVAIEIRKASSRSRLTPCQKRTGSRSINDN